MLCIRPSPKKIIIIIITAQKKTPQGTQKCYTWEREGAQQVITNNYMKWCLCECERVRERAGLRVEIEWTEAFGGEGRQQESRGLGSWIFVYIHM